LAATGGNRLLRHGITGKPTGISELAGSDLLLPNGNRLT